MESFWKATKFKSKGIWSFLFQLGVNNLKMHIQNFNEDLVNNQCITPTVNINQQAYRNTTNGWFFTGDSLQWYIIIHCKYFSTYCKDNSFYSFQDRKFLFARSIVHQRCACYFDFDNFCKKKKNSCWNWKYFFWLNIAYTCIEYSISLDSSVYQFRDDKWSMNTVHSKENPVYCHTDSFSLV